MHAGRPILLAALVVLAGARLAAQGAEAPWPPPRQVVVSPAEMAFERRDHPVNSSESIYFMTRFNDGWVLLSNFFEFRNPLFRKWGIYIVLTDPHGRSWFLKHDIRDQDIRTDPARLGVTDGRNSITSGPGWYRVVFDFPGIRADLRIENILPPWKAGSGTETFGRAARASATRVLGSPWGTVSGSLSLEGPAMEIHGQGMLEKATIVAPLNRQEPLLYAIRVFSSEDTLPPDRWYIGVLDITSHEAYGSVRSSRLEVAHGADWVFTTPDYTLEPLDIRDVEGSPYPAPQAVRLGARFNGNVLDAVYRAGVLFNVTDVIQEIPAWVRPLVRLLIRRPVYLRFLGRMEGTLTRADGVVESFLLYGPYEYVLTRQADSR